MTDQPKIDLAAEGLLPATTPTEPEQQPATEATEADLAAFVMESLKNIQDSVASFHIGMRMLNTRISQVERYVSYLLEKDPDIGPKLQAHLAKLKEMESALAEAQKDADKADAGPTPGT